MAGQLEHPGSQTRRAAMRGIRSAIRRTMLDITLSILALIAGGVVLELFTGAPALGGQADGQSISGAGNIPLMEELQVGNPS